MSTETAPGSAPGLGRKLAFTAVLLALSWLFLELAAFGLLSLRAGTVVGWGELAAARSPAGGATAETDSARGIREQLPRRHRDEQALHPFLGFVLDPERHPAARRPSANPISAELGFPFNRDSLLQSPDPDRLVVAVFGGSVANLLANAGRSELAAALSEIPRFRGRAPVIVSAANPGYKQPQQLMTLNYLLALGAHFDLVLNLDGFNEVALPPVELEPLSASPVLPQNWPLRVGDLDAARLAALGELALIRRERAARAATFGRAPLSKSFLAGLFFTALDARSANRAAELSAGLTGLTGDGAALGFQQRGPRLPTESAAAQSPIELWSRSSRLMADLCAARGIEYHHLLQPNQYDPESKPLSPEERRTAWRADHPYRLSVEEAYPRLRAAGSDLRAAGIAFHDLSGIFSQVAETLYVDDCCHLNQRGNELLARAVARQIGALSR